MTRRWEPCGAHCEVGDVVRWREGIWHSKRSKKKRKVTRLGTREVTGQVMSMDRKDYLCLSVLKCVIIENRFGRAIAPYKKSDLIKRKRGTLARGGAEKLTELEPKRKPVSRFMA